MTKDSRLVLRMTLSSVAYATVRNNVLKGVVWSDWPVYVLNKAPAMSALILLLIWVVRVRRCPHEPRPILLTAAGRLVLMHAGLSLAILAPAYFPAFFSDGKLTWQAGVSVLAGVLAATGLHVGSRSGLPRSGRVSVVGVAACLAGTHAMLLGYGSWLTPATWPGHMAPITLISFVVGIAAIAAALWPVGDGTDATRRWSLAMRGHRNNARAAVRCP